MRRRQHPFVAQYDAATMEYTVLVESDQPRPRAGIAGHASHDPGVLGPGNSGGVVVGKVKVRAPPHPVGIDVLDELEFGTYAASFRFAFHQNSLVRTRTEQRDMILLVQTHVTTSVVTGRPVYVLYFTGPDLEKKTKKKTEYF